MKKLLIILALGLLWCNAGISGENKFTVRNININLSAAYELQKIGSMGVAIWATTKWQKTFYAHDFNGFCQ